jgi:hypothetical protein
MRFTRLAAMTVPASLALVAVAALAETATPPVNPAEKERRICRRIENPGTLAGSRRVCLTRAEWERSAEEHRRRGEEWVRSLDACNQRAEGGTPVGGGPGEATAAAMARIAGC